MFEHRLGLALGKTIGEIRALPATEFRRWQLFYMLEPWGWADAEYRTAIALSLLFNIHRGKESAKDVSEFMRDMPKETLKYLEGADKNLIPEDLPFEERKARAMELARQFFGGNAVIQKKV
jgi:hypothetical protein